ncbi:cytidine deaminase-like protein [Xylaria acuta]|nr:cytidine deaminase-like protein [Xylaria acuta]
MTTSQSSSFTPTDLTHLRRTIALAAEALEAGDAPFGSVLVGGSSGDSSGNNIDSSIININSNSNINNNNNMLREDRNRTTTLNDGTRHPEFELARWAAANMTSGARAAATVYTSGEHCAMCAAAHAYVGLGRVVYAASAEQLVGWMAEFRREKGEEEEEEEEEERKVSVASLPIRAVAPRVEVRGPVPELESEIKALHRRYAGL